MFGVQVDLMLGAVRREAGVTDLLTYGAFARGLPHFHTHLLSYT
jgi:hypothetical protein